MQGLFSCHRPPVRHSQHLLIAALAGQPAAARFWRGLLAVLLLAVTWLALTPAPPPAAALLWDKFNHMAAFASLALAAQLGFRRRWLRVALGLLAYGALIELLQALTPTRVGDAADLLADAAGIALGQAAAALAVRWARRTMA
jgi:VanZ family protein